LEEKQNLLSNLLPSLAAHWNNKETPQKTSQKIPSHFPSPFLINTILKLKGADKLHEKQKSNLNPNQSFDYGESLGNFILKSKNHINEHQQQLANPNSLMEYYQAIPKVITMFFDGFIGVILKHHHELRQYKRKYYNLKTKIDDTEQDPMQLIKITTFLSSIIIKMTFRRSKIWFTNLFASLCRRPQFLGSLQLILRSLHVISHTEDHERRLEIKRMERVDPKSRIINGPNIWPLVVIDNLDTKQKTFKHNNYYNEGRTSFHVVLRLCFFFTLPSPICEIVDEGSMIYEKETKFGFNQFSSEKIKLFEDVFKRLLNYQTSLSGESFNKVDDEEIYQEIIKHIPEGTLVPPPKVVILEAGGKPDDDQGIYESIEMFLDEIDTTDGFLDIAADEAIFRRIINYKKIINPDVRIRHILGQWHTNKDMCSVLINIFSGYGIFNLAKAFGAKYLANFQKIVDYRATSRLLELIWVAVGTALSIFTTKHQVSIDELLENPPNSFIKVWILYWRWSSLLRSHKLGIRKGNWDFQIESLIAFGPLFPVAGKVNYATSVCHFLAMINKDPQFDAILRTVSSINLTRPDHYLGFDEALETYGVKFVKQFLTKSIADEESLKLQIKSVQDEKERLNSFLFEFVDSKKKNPGKYKANSLKEPLWKLTTDLLDLFENFDSNMTHHLIEMAPELTTDGFNSLFNSYDIGKRRMEALLNQEVHGTEEINTIGRRSTNVKVYKYEKLVEIYSKKKKEKGKATNLEEIEEEVEGIEEVEEPNSNNNPIDPSIPIKEVESSNKRRKTTPQEHAILDPLVEMDTKPTKEQIDRACADTGWDRKRVLDYVGKHRKKKKPNNNK
jgi:hypothetical protein